MAKQRVAKTTTTTDLAITVPTTQAEVPVTIEALKAKLAELKGPSIEKISLDLCYDGNGKNIKDVDTVSELLEIDSAVKARAAAYNERVTARGLTGRVKSFEISGKSAEHWDKVIEKAINTLINKVQIEKLENAITELSKHLDAETRLKQTLADITASATGLIK